MTIPGVSGGAGLGWDAETTRRASVPLPVQVDMPRAAMGQTASTRPPRTAYIRS